MCDDDAVAISHLAAIKQGWSEPYRRSVLEQYIGYMDKAAEGLVDSPMLDVDALWHEHLLHSTSYVRFCQARYGRYIHHEPRLDDDLAAILAARLGGHLPGFLSARTAQGTLGVANCGQPNGPDPPDPGRGVSQTVSELANCGNPQPQEPVPPPRLFARANCGLLRQLPQSVS
jgi:hypothetical protein